MKRDLRQVIHKTVDVLNATEVVRMLDRLLAKVLAKICVFWAA